MTRFTSSASKAKKDIFWLLLDPVNTFAAPHIFPLTDYEWQHTRAEEFMRYRLSSEIQSWFGFHPELSTMRLWIPRNRIPIQDVKPEWFAKNFDLTSIATHYPLLHSTMNCFLGEGKPLEEPQQDVIHLIVTAKRQEQQDEKEHEKSDTRSRLGLHTYRNYRTIVEGSGIPSPSAAAKSGKYAILQANPQTTIYDGFYNISFPADTTALPIEVYHPVFRNFMKNISTAKPSKELLTEVLGLMTTSTGVGTVESSLATDLRSALTNILGKYMGQAIVSGAIPNDVIQKMGHKCAIPLLVMEYKRAVGEGGCDPLTQASYSALKHWQDASLAEIRDRSCCPTFIIAGGGPYLAILGAVLTDKYIVQRLTGLEWLGRGHVFEDGHLYRTAQVFDSLRRALQDLDNFHDKLDEMDLKLVDGKLVNGTPHPRFYPHYTEFTDRVSKAVVQFEYSRSLYPSNKSPFLVKLKPSGQLAVVKFVARYGADAHQILAEAGMAPKLLFCGSIDGKEDVRSTCHESAKDVFGLHLGQPQMVVMDYVDGTHGEYLKAVDWPKDARAQVKAMIDKLHELDYVFGDLRPPNVVFSGGKAFLVDFDWAGKCGEVFYPGELGEGITKHCEGRDLQVIKKGHDLALLDHYFP